ncbi:MAG: DUF2807 domain-containing protein [Bacteroidaceae bacterium]|nr:DUF2807 domain-containing protein [Bacteroidaceae bacterium]
MKFRTILSAATIAVAAVITTSCGMSSHDIKLILNGSEDADGYRDSGKWGEVTDKTINVGQQFNAILINGGCNVDFTQSDSISLVAHGNEKAIEAYEIKVKDSTLIISRKKEYSNRLTIPKITLNLSHPEINDVHINGAGDIDFKEDYNIKGALNININGAGDMEAKKIECDEFCINVNGAGDFISKKITCNKKAEFTISGAGDIDSNVKAQKVNTTISGAGDAKVEVDCTDLYVTVMGAGEIELKGKCINFHRGTTNFSSIDSKKLQYKKKI